jgi:hypothetical protein
MAIRLRRVAVGFGARLRDFFGIHDLSKLTYLYASERN